LIRPGEMSEDRGLRPSAARGNWRGRWYKGGGEKRAATGDPNALIMG